MDGPDRYNTSARGPASTMRPEYMTAHVVGDGVDDGEVVGDIDEGRTAAARQLRSKDRARALAC